MKGWKYFFRNLWSLITIGRLKTNREKLEDLAKAHGYSGIEVMPKRTNKYRASKPFKKAPRVYTLSRKPLT